MSEQVASGYVVWCPQQERRLYIIPEYTQAEQNAREMAALNPGTQWFVLEIKSESQGVATVTTTHRT